MAFLNPYQHGFIFPPPPRSCGSSKYHFLTLFLLCSLLAVDANAQNSITGKLINAPGDATQEIPSRQLVLEFYDPPAYETPPSYQYGSTSYNSSSQQNTYSINFTGGPFFMSSFARVYVDYGSISNNPNIHSSCITSGDVSRISGYLSNTVTLSSLEMIAADVNLDGVVNLADKEMLENVVLGTLSNYDNSITVGGTLHNDVSVVYPSLPLPTNPLNFSPEYDVNPIGSRTGIDFASIRLGDVNGNCATYQSATYNGGEGNNLRSTSPGNTPNAFGDTQNIEIGPNPFNDQLSVSFNSSGFKSLSLFDLSGKELLSITNQNGSKNLRLEESLLSDLPKGTYFVKILTEEGNTSTHKVVKQ